MHMSPDHVENLLWNSTELTVKNFTVKNVIFEKEILFPKCHFILLH